MQQKVLAKLKVSAALAAATAMTIAAPLSVLAAPKDFDAKFYAQQNPDVVAQVGNDPAALAKHFDEHGQKEGRAYNLENAKELFIQKAIAQYGNGKGLSRLFNAKFYAEKNPDIVAKLGTDPLILFEHFLRFGLEENRMPSEHVTAQEIKGSSPIFTAFFGTEEEKSSVDFSQVSFSAESIDAVVEIADKVVELHVDRDLPTETVETPEEVDPEQPEEENDKEVPSNTATSISAKIQMVQMMAKTANSRIAGLQRLSEGLADNVSAAAQQASDTAAAINNLPSNPSDEQIKAILAMCAEGQQKTTVVSQQASNIQNFAQDTITILNNNITITQNIINEYEKILSPSLNQIKALQQARTTLESQRDEALRELQAAQNTLTAAQQTLSDAEDAYEIANEAAATANTELGTARDNNNAAKRACQEAQAALTDVENAITKFSLETEISGLEAQIGALEQEDPNYDAQLAALQGEINAKQEQADGIETTIDTTSGITADDLNERKNTATSNLGSKNDAQEITQRAEDAAQQAADNANSTLTNKQNDVTTAQTNVRTVESEVAAKEQTLQTAKDKVTENTQQLTTLSDQVYHSAEGVLYSEAQKSLVEQQTQLENAKQYAQDAAANINTCADQYYEYYTFEQAHNSVEEQKPSQEQPANDSEGN